MQEQNRPLRVEDFLGPVGHYRPFIPEFLRKEIIGMTAFSSSERMSLLESTYYEALTFVEDILDERVPLETEADAQKAADLAARLIIDAAWLHQQCCRIGLPVGSFPYNHFASVLFPEFEEDKESENENTQDVE